MTCIRTGKVTAVFCWGHSKAYALISSIVKSAAKDCRKIVAFVQSKKEEEIFSFSKDSLIYYRYCDGESLEPHVHYQNEKFENVLLYINADTIDNSVHQELLEGILVLSTRINLTVVLNCSHITSLTLRMRANIDHVIVFPTPTIKDDESLELQPSEQIRDLIGLTEYTAQRIKYLTTFKKKGHLVQFNLCDLLWSNDESVFLDYIELPQ
jgi:hypothetical protein